MRAAVCLRAGARTAGVPRAHTRLQRLSLSPVISCCCCCCCGDCGAAPLRRRRGRATARRQQGGAVLAQLQRRRRQRQQRRGARAHGRLPARRSKECLFAQSNIVALIRSDILHRIMRAARCDTGGKKHHALGLCACTQASTHPVSHASPPAGGGKPLLCRRDGVHNDAVYRSKALGEEGSRCARRPFGKRREGPDKEQLGSHSSQTRLHKSALYWCHSSSATKGEPVKNDTKNC